jgi:hypothetical protein
MFIEQWVYQHLGRPELKVMGEVLIDLSADRRIDWIALVDTLEEYLQPVPRIARRAVVYGGCEAHIIAGYLAAATEQVSVHGNYAAHGLFVRMDSAANLLDRGDRPIERFTEEADALGLPVDLETTDPLANAGDDALFVFNLTTDAGGHPLIRHRREGWLMALEPRGAPGTHFLVWTDDELRAHLSTGSYSDPQRAHILKVAQHMRAHYELVPPATMADKMHWTREIIERIPQGGRCLFLVNHDEELKEYPSRRPTRIEAIGNYLAHLRDLSADYSYAAVLSVSEVIESVDDLREANHYARSVYLRLAQRLSAMAGTLPARADAPASPLRVVRSLRRRADPEERQREAEELVLAGYQSLLRRDPEPGAVEHHSARMLSGEMTPAQFLRNMSSCEEFLVKWSKI